MKIFLSIFLCLTLHPTQRADGQGFPAQHFDTASIRLSNPDDRGFGYNPNPNNFQAKGVDLKFLIEIAYGAKASDITEIPSAFRGLRFDIHAKSDVDPASPEAKLRYSSDEGGKLFEARLQALLAERFQLKLHHGTAVRPVLNLEVTKHVHLATSMNQNPMQTFGPGHLKFDSIDMDGFAKALGEQLSTNVIDHTGLQGIYAVEIKWNVSDHEVVLTYPFASVNDALDEQLGLKLVPAKASVPILVVDRAMPPTPN